MLIGACLTTALLTQFSSAFLVLGVALLPGLRSDRAAWELRGSAVVAGLVFAVVWGTNFRAQFARNTTWWIPNTTPQIAQIAQVETGRLMSLFYPEQGALAMLVVGFGMWSLWRHDAHLGRVLVALSAFGIIAVVVVGIKAHILAARAFAIESWGVFVAYGGVMELARARQRVALVALGMLLVVTMVPSLSGVYTWEEEATRATREMARVMRPGDGAIAPTADDGSRFAWSVGTPFDTPADPRVPGPPSGYAQLVPGEPPTRRVWSFHIASLTYPAVGLARYPAEQVPPITLGDDLVLECFQPA